MGKRPSGRQHASMVVYMAMVRSGHSHLRHDQCNKDHQGNTLVPWIILLSQSLQWRPRFPPWRCRAGAK